MLVRALTMSVLLTALVFAGSARAQAGHGPCAEDRAKFCKDVPAGHGKIQECLQEHKGELTPACKERIAEVKKAIGPCQPDIEKFCGDVAGGQGRIRVCLKQHGSELSPECRKHLESGGAPRGAASRRP